MVRQTKRLTLINVTAEEQSGKLPKGSITTEDVV
jgi:hypothetical protein